MFASIGLVRALLFVAVLCGGLVAGATFGIWQGYDPRALNAAAFVAMHQGAVRGLNVLLPLLGLIAILSIAISAWLMRRERTVLWLLVAALFCMVAAGSSTRFFNQPINAEVMNWTADSVPDNWTDLRATWWQWHVARTVAAILGFAFTVAAALRTSTETHRKP
jgi:uncharacterized membrane protein